MTRRWALAAAFFLTAMFGFVVVAYGSNTGMFAWSDGGARNNAAQPPASPQSATAVPAIVTDFVYVDPTADAQQAPVPASGERERDHEEREHEGEHDDDGYEHEDDD